MLSLVVYSHCRRVFELQVFELQGSTHGARTTPHAASDDDSVHLADGRRDDIRSRRGAAQRGGRRQRQTVVGLVKLQLKCGSTPAPTRRPPTPNRQTPAHRTTPCPGQPVIRTAVQDRPAVPAKIRGPVASRVPTRARTPSATTAIMPKPMPVRRLHRPPRRPRATIPPTPRRPGTPRRPNLPRPPPRLQRPRRQVHRAALPRPAAPRLRRRSYRRPRPARRQ